MWNYVMNDSKAGCCCCCCSEQRCILITTLFCKHNIFRWSRWVSCWWRPSALLHPPCCCGNFWLCFSHFLFPFSLLLVFFRGSKYPDTYCIVGYSNDEKKRKERNVCLLLFLRFQVFGFFMTTTFELEQLDELESAPMAPFWSRKLFPPFIFDFLAAGVQVGGFIFTAMKGDGMFVARSTRWNAAKTWRSIQMGSDDSRDDDRIN